MSASNIDKCQILSVVGNHVISCPDILDFVAMVFTKICHDIHWVSTFQTSAFIKLHPVVFNPTITPNILDSIINLQHIFLGVHSFNLNTRSGLWQQHFGLWFCSSHAPKITLHLVFHGFHPSPPPKAPYLWDSKVSCPKKHPYFSDSPVFIQSGCVLYPRGPAPRDPAQPAPRWQETTENLPIETQPVQQCGGCGGPTRYARAQTPRHLPGRMCKYAQPGPAGFPTVSGPSPVTRGKEAPLPFSSHLYPSPSAWDFASVRPYHPCRYRDAAAAAPKCGRQRLLSCLLRCRLGHVVAGANLLAMAMAVDTVQGKLLPLLRLLALPFSQRIAGISVAS